MRKPISRIKEMVKFEDFKEKKILKKFSLLLVLSVVIGYLISPKILFVPTKYQEGDIIRQTLVIEEDLLIPDKVSTRLKKEKLLSEQKLIYDFDPNILEKIGQQVISSFKQTRLQFGQLEGQSKEIQKQDRLLGVEYFSAIQQQHEIKQQIFFYKKYEAILNSQLFVLNKGGKLSTKGFERKKKLDGDLQTVSHLLHDFAEKLKYFQREQERFADRFEKAQEEYGTFLDQIKERKDKVKQEFIASLHIKLADDSEQQVLGFDFYGIEIEDKLLQLLSELLNKKIVGSKSILRPEKFDKIEIRNLATGEIMHIDTLKAFQSFLDIDEVRTLVSDMTQSSFAADETGKKRNFIIMLGQKLISPTITENKQEFEKRRLELIEGISPVFFSVKKGEIIARTGDRATRHQMEKINSYYEAVSNVDKIPRLAGIILIVLLALILVSFSFKIREKDTGLSFKNLLLIMVAVLLTLVLVKGGVVIGEIVETRYTEIQSEMYRYLLPIALSSMLAGILLKFEAGLMAGLLSSLFISIMMQGNLYYFFFGIMGSIVASLPMTSFESRYSLLLHGLKISAVNVPMVIIIYLVESNQIGNFNWYGIGSALLGGVFTAIITSILLPFFESIFDITTNFKLLELSNMNHPVLKELILKAPGTYHHSIIVGNLAESGAQKIGANPLLARVASYYHDIGKAIDSQFYVENQPPSGTNIHDNMNPFESAKVIIAHLQKGAKIADRHRLGSAITDILLQHHGTKLVDYFYSKAQNMSANPEDKEETDETLFRYRGPKPQSLEAALVMLADVAEPSSRSLDDPTPESIVEMVKKVCWTVLEEGQLDESGLTLHMFKTVVDIYIAMLISIHHHRIKYPEKTNFIQQLPNN